MKDIVCHGVGIRHAQVAGGQQKTNKHGILHGKYKPQ